MATININVGENDVININVNNAESTNASEPKLGKKELYEKIYHELKLYAKENKKQYWYEVWIDFDEGWDGIYEQIKDLHHQAMFDTCLGFINRMEYYYDSPKYYQDLNKMIKDMK